MSRTETPAQDRQALSELQRISDLARLLWERYEQATIDRRQIMAPPEAARANIDYCNKLAADLAELARLVRKHLSHLWPTIPLVAHQAHWQNQANFNWAAARLELDQIDAATVQATGLQTPTTTDKAPARKGRSGRRPTTKPLASYANTRRNRTPPMAWSEIAVEYLSEHPEATTNASGKPLTWNHVRDAWRRYYGDKKPKQRKRPARRNAQNI